MKHVNDPGTLELQFPKKRGRPTLYASALTPAERARRYRRRRFQRMEEALSDLQRAPLKSLLEWLAMAERHGHAPHLGWEVAAEVARRFPKPR